LNPNVGFDGPGHIFSEALPDSMAVRGRGAIHLGVESSVAFTIREVGYPPGSGYVGVGTTEPTAILTVAGEDSPRIHLTSNSGANPQAPSTTWALVSFTDQKLYVTDVTGSRLDVEGDAKFARGLTVVGDCTVGGDLVVAGSGSAAVETRRHGKRLLNALEGASARLGATRVLAPHRRKKPI